MNSRRLHAGELSCDAHRRVEENAREATALCAVVPVREISLSAPAMSDGESGADACSVGGTRRCIWLQPKASKDLNVTRSIADRTTAHVARVKSSDEGPFVRAQLSNRCREGKRAIKPLRLAVQLETRLQASGLSDVSDLAAIDEQVDITHYVIASHVDLFETVDHDALAFVRGTGP